MFIVLNKKSMLIGLCMVFGGYLFILIGIGILIWGSKFLYIDKYGDVCF